MFDHLLRAKSIRMWNCHHKSFFFRVFKTIAFVKTCLSFNKLELISTNVWFILVSRLILELNTNEHNQEPFINDRMIIKVNAFDDFILLMLIFGKYLELILILQANFVVFTLQLDQNQLHVKVDYSQTSQFSTVNFMISKVIILWLFSLFSNSLTQLSQLRWIKFTEIITLGDSVWIIAQNVLLIVELPQNSLSLLKRLH